MLTGVDVRHVQPQHVGRCAPPRDGVSAPWRAAQSGSPGEVGAASPTHEDLSKGRGTDYFLFSEINSFSSSPGVAYTEWDVGHHSLVRCFLYARIWTIFDLQVQGMLHTPRLLTPYSSSTLGLAIPQGEQPNGTRQHSFTSTAHSHGGVNNNVSQVYE